MRAGDMLVINHALWTRNEWGGGGGGRVKMLKPISLLQLLWSQGAYD